MSIGRTFKEALQKGIRSMEVRRYGLGLDRNDRWWCDYHDRGKAAEAQREAGAKTPQGGNGAVAGSRAAEAPPDWREQAAGKSGYTRRLPRSSPCEHLR